MSVRDLPVYSYPDEVARKWKAERDEFEAEISKWKGLYLEARKSGYEERKEELEEAIDLIREIARMSPNSIGSSKAKRWLEERDL